MPKKSKNSKNKVKALVRPGVKGKGSYKDYWQAMRKYVPRVVGGALGGIVGQPERGWNLGGEVSKMIGWGRYRQGVSGSGPYGVPWTTVSNTLTSEGNIPQVGTVQDKGIRVCHSEFLGVVTSTTGFTNTSYPLNPGLVGTFPWLSKIAANFQQWQMKGCLVVFKSQMTDAVATFSSLGSVAIAANMNPAERPCANQQEIEQLKFCAVAKPSFDIVAPIECAKWSTSNECYFIRNSSVPSAASIMDYDHGTIQVAVNACPSNSVVLGRLYITYDIELINPRMVMGASGVDSYALTGTTTADYLGALQSMLPTAKTIGCTFTSPNNYIIFPRGSYGTYEIDYGAVGASTALADAITFSFVNCIRSTTYKPFGGQASITNAAGSTSTRAYIQCIVEITDITQQALVLFASGTVPLTPTAGASHVKISALTGIIPGVAPVVTALPPLPGAPVLAPDIIARVNQLDDEEDDEKYPERSPVVAASAAGSVVARAVRRFQTP